jgi:hypothetical protein
LPRGEELSWPSFANAIRMPTRRRSSRVSEKAISVAGYFGRGNGSLGFANATFATEEKPKRCDVAWLETGPSRG